MREILFRGKRKDNGEWIEGYYVEARDYLTGEVITYIFPTDITLYPHSEFSGCEEVIPETVGQFTGLIDDLGNKVFDGDIVKGQKLYDVGCYPNYVTLTTPVTYDDDLCVFKPLHKFVINGPVMVVGNIYDNPELLGVHS